VTDGALPVVSSGSRRCLGPTPNVRLGETFSGDTRSDIDVNCVARGGQNRDARSVLPTDRGDGTLPHPNRVDGRCCRWQSGTRSRRYDRVAINQPWITYAGLIRRVLPLLLWERLLLRGRRIIPGRRLLLHGAGFLLGAGLSSPVPPSFLPARRLLSGLLGGAAFFFRAQASSGSGLLLGWGERGSLWRAAGFLLRVRADWTVPCLGQRPAAFFASSAARSIRQGRCCRRPGGRLGLDDALSWQRGQVNKLGSRRSSARVRRLYAQTAAARWTACAKTSFRRW